VLPLYNEYLANMLPKLVRFDPARSPISISTLAERGLPRGASKRGCELRQKFLIKFIEKLPGLLKVAGIESPSEPH